MVKPVQIEWLEAWIYYLLFHSNEFDIDRVDRIIAKIVFESKEMDLILCFVYILLKIILVVILPEKVVVVF